MNLLFHKDKYCEPCIRPIAYPVLGSSGAADDLLSFSEDDSDIQATVNLLFHVDKYCEMRTMYFCFSSYLY